MDGPAWILGPERVLTKPTDWSVLYGNIPSLPCYSLLPPPGVVLRRRPKHAGATLSAVWCSAICAESQLSGHIDGVQRQSTGAPGRAPAAGPASAAIPATRHENESTPSVMHPKW